MTNEELRLRLLKRFLATVSGIENPEQLARDIIDYSNTLKQDVVTNYIYNLIARSCRYGIQDNDKIVVKTIAQFGSDRSPIKTPSVREINFMVIIYNRLTSKMYKKKIISKLLGVDDPKKCATIIIERIIIDIMPDYERSRFTYFQRNWVKRKLESKVTSKDELWCYDLITTMLLSTERIILNRYRAKECKV